MNAPCMNCSDRFIGCHSSCDKYSKYKTRSEEIQNNRKKELLPNIYIKKEVERSKKG